MVRCLTNKVPLKVYVTVTDVEMSTRRTACVELGLRRIVLTSSWRRRLGGADLAAANRRRRVVLEAYFNMVLYLVFLLQEPEPSFIPQYGGTQNGLPKIRTGMQVLNKHILNK